MGNVYPSGALGAEGDPGLISTKKFPSRKMRGRIQKVASWWMGKPLSSIDMVTLAAVHSCWGPLMAWIVQPFMGATLCTLPTLTPAIRTSASCLRPLALGKIACAVYEVANGLANLV